MPDFLMMCGLPYSGKSTYAEDLAETAMSLGRKVVIHSSDAIRAELYGDEGDQTHNDKVFQTLHRRIKADLQSGKNVVYDATNLSYKKRMATLQLVSRIPCRKICVFMAVPFDEIVERSRHRTRVVPYEVLRRMYESVWVPNKYEGWDEVNLVYPHGFETKNRDELMKSLCKIPHDNPHHTLSIGDHCYKTADLLQAHFGCTQELLLAAILHDIGKAFTKSFTNSRGEPSEIAHFYNHQHVSAYDSLFYIPKGIDRLHVAAIIQWHMKPFEIEHMPVEKQSDAWKKFRELVGDKIYWEVTRDLHAADLAAH